MLKQIHEFILKLYHEYEEMVNYLIIGVCTTIISLVVKYALLFTILDAKDPMELQISVIASWIVSVIFAYITNKTFVFKSRAENLLKEISLFFSSRLATLLMESVFLWFFISHLKLDSDFYVIIWTLLTQVFLIIGNYLFSKFIVFSNKHSNFSK